MTTPAWCELSRFVKEVQRKEALAVLASWLWRGACLGSLSGSLILLLALVWPQHTNHIYLGAALALLGSLVTFGYLGWRQRPTTHQTAKRIDDTLGLRDRISSAMSFLPPKNAAEVLVLEDALQHLNHAMPRELVQPKPLRGFVILLPVIFCLGISTTKPEPPTTALNISPIERSAIPEALPIDAGNTITGGASAKKNNAPTPTKKTNSPINEQDLGAKTLPRPCQANEPSREEQIALMLQRWKSIPDKGEYALLKVVAKTNLTSLSDMEELLPSRRDYVRAYFESIHPKINAWLPPDCGEQ